MTTEKKQMIEELIAGQRKFIQEINEVGHSESDYWLEKQQYRKRQEELAKNIHNTAHRQYLGEYESKSLVDDITGDGGWLSEDTDKPERPEDK